MRRYWVLLTTIVVMAFNTATAEVPLQSTDKNQIENILPLPVEELQAVQANGEVFFIAKGGRFVIRGTMYDSWYRSPLNSIDEIEDSFTRIRFDRMGNDLGEYNTLTIGTGPDQVVAFVDPICDICHKLIHDAERLGNKYTFKFIVVPALGDDSDRLARRIFCAAKPEESLAAFKSRSINTLAQKEGCDVAGYNATLLMAQVMGIEGVPFVVAPDGRSAKGRPRKLAKWLEGSL